MSREDHRRDPMPDGTPACTCGERDDDELCPRAKAFAEHTRRVLEAAFDAAIAKRNREKWRAK